MSKKIFIVDDADFIVDMLRLIFQNAGHRIVGAASAGATALEEISLLPPDLKPDVVTIDFHMPQMDGMEMTRRVKKLLPNVKILLVSAHATYDVAMKAREAGVDGFIIKPFEPQTILEAIDRFATP